jgi:hypothetical protein
LSSAAKLAAHLFTADFAIAIGIQTGKFARREFVPVQHPVAVGVETGKRTLLHQRFARILQAGEFGLRQCTVRILVELSEQFCFTLCALCGSFRTFRPLGGTFAFHMGSARRTESALFAVVASTGVMGFEFCGIDHAVSVAVYPGEHRGRPGFEVRHADRESLLTGCRWLAGLSRILCPGAHACGQDCGAEQGPQ